MNYATKAALRLDQQRISLRKQHRSLLADLEQSRSGEKPRAELTERIESLRNALKQSMTESIELSRTMVAHMERLNFGSMGDAVLAQKRISFIYGDVMKTLNELDKRRDR